MCEPTLCSALPVFALVGCAQPCTPPAVHGHGHSTPGGRLPCGFVLQMTNDRKKQPIDLNGNRPSPWHIHIHAVLPFCNGGEESSKQVVPLQPNSPYSVAAFPSGLPCSGVKTQQVYAYVYVLCNLLIISIFCGLLRCVIKYLERLNKTSTQDSIHILHVIQMNESMEGDTKYLQR